MRLKKVAFNIEKLLVNVHLFLFYSLGNVFCDKLSSCSIESNSKRWRSRNFSLVQTGFMGLFALLGGFFIDSMGRKRIAVTGFILLGIGTAILGINSTKQLQFYTLMQL